MPEMSPLAGMLMIILQRCTWVAAALVALFAGILVWQRYTPGGFVWQAGDKGFLVLMGLLFLLAIYLIRSIGREVGRNTHSSGDGSS